MDHPEPGQGAATKKGVMMGAQSPEHHPRRQETTFILSIMRLRGVTANTEHTCPRVGVCAHAEDVGGGEQKTAASIQCRLP